jgi:membrane protein
MNPKQSFRRLSTRWDLATRKAKKVSIVGFNDVPIYYVVSFFLKGLINGNITTRASAVAFSFFIAIFPTIIFIFTLIPFIPIDNFQVELLSLVKGIIPRNAFDLIEDTLVDVVTRKSSGLLSFGFIAAVFFSHNGISSLIDAFNATYHTIESRGFVAQHLISFLLTVVLAVLAMIAVVLIFFGQLGLNFLVEKHWLQVNFTYYLIVYGRWLVTIALVFFSVSLLYYWAPAKRTKFTFISLGSIVATLLILLTSIGFSYFVNNFGQYNTLYGSIGSILALMAWMYFNALVLMIGFELNASIKSAGIQVLKNNSEKENG